MFRIDEASLKGHNLGERESVWQQLFGQCQRDLRLMMALGHASQSWLHPGSSLCLLKRHSCAVGLLLGSPIFLSCSAHRYQGGNLGETL